MAMFETAMFLETFQTLQRNIHAWAWEWGFWDGGGRTVTQDGCTGPQEVYLTTRPANVGEKIALAHSELSEALEAHRRTLPDGFQIHEMQWWSDDGGVYASPNVEMPIGILKPEGVGVELADAVIRIMDLAEYLKIDLAQAILDKVAYNRTRPHRHNKSY